MFNIQKISCVVQLYDWMGFCKGTDSKQNKPLSTTMLSENAKNQIKSTIYIFFQLILVLFISGFSSFLIFWLFKKNFIPYEIINREVFIDYSTQSPLAKIDILSKNDQWNYIDNIESGHESYFFKRNTKYDISGQFTIPKSRSNFELGKTTIFISLINSEGDIIARSTRSLLIPYQSKMSLFLDSFLKFPLRILNIYPTNEAINVNLNFFNNYVENSRSTTQFIELRFSNSDFLVSQCLLSIVPNLKGFTYLLYYFPNLSFFFGFSFLFLLHLSILFPAAMVINLIRISSLDSDPSVFDLRSNRKFEENNDDFRNLVTEDPADKFASEQDKPSIQKFNPVDVQMIENRINEGNEENSSFLPAHKKLDDISIDSISSNEESNSTSSDKSCEEIFEEDIIHQFRLENLLRNRKK